MKKLEEKKIRNLLSYYEDSAYLRSDNLREYAAELMEDEFPFNKDFTFEELEEWEENIQPAEEDILIHARYVDDGLPEIHIQCNRNHPKSFGFD